MVVPGIMGTRLSDSFGRAVWNPLGGPTSADAGYFAADVARLGNLNPLLPDLWNPFHPILEKHHFDRAKEVVNASNLIWPFYGELCWAMHEFLDQKFKVLRRSVKPRVYACGYDWRQSNSVSVDRVREIVSRARMECDGEEVILIAHSMGGLLSRYFCKQGGEKDVRALYLLGSPTLGSPEAYYTLKIGMPGMMIRLFALESLTEAGSRQLARSMPGLYDLLPTQLYGKRVDPAWLGFDAKKTGFPEFVNRSLEVRPDPANQFSDCSAAQHTIYEDSYTGFFEDAVQRAANAPHVSLSTAFQNSLVTSRDTVYMHPRTCAIFTSNRRTCKGVEVPFSHTTTSGRVINVHTKSVSMRRADCGDGTVPHGSACPPNPSHPFMEIYALNGVPHPDMANNDQVIQFLLRDIPRRV